ncbi:MAG: Mov34/MPN/PAD-1 family protein [Desulfurococcaceae archaeon]|nr:Mov34/MPN/PAD-1 family protein [Desulfurococcaceae archaeon]
MVRVVKEPPSSTPGCGAETSLPVAGVVVPREILSELCSLHSRYGREVAGLAIGVEVSGVLVVEDLVIGENLAESADRFYLDPVAIVEAYRYAELLEGRDVVALVHTHPGGAYPSYLDLEGMELWPLTWVIVDSENCTARAWIRRGKRIWEVPLTAPRP